MEEPGSGPASSTPAALSVSAELDAMFDDVTSDSPVEETTSTESVKTSEANPQDSTVQPPSPIDFEADDDTPAVEDDAPKTPAKTESEPAPEVEAASPISDEDKEGEEYEIRGKKWIRYPEARGKEVFAGYQASKALQRELGYDQPVTPEAVKQLAGDKALLDNIDFDVMSNDPADQARAFRYLFTTARKAYDQGHAAHNPHATMADAFLHAAETSAPEVIAGIEHRVTQETFNRLYQKAIAAGIETEAGKELLNSVQRAEQALTGNYRKRADLAKQPPPPDKIDQRLQVVEAREAEQAAQQSQQAKAAWDYWYEGTRGAIWEGITGAIGNVIKPVAGSFKNFPETQKNVETRLREEVREALNADRKLASLREQYVKQASIAGSESVRDGWRARLVQMYAAKADQVLRDKAPKILSETAANIKARSDKTHQRLQGTQSLRGTPAGGSAPNGTTAPASGNNKFDSKSWANEFEAAFN
jgi:hypothetical protein